VPRAALPNPYPLLMKTAKHLKSLTCRGVGAKTNKFHFVLGKACAVAVVVVVVALTMEVAGVAAAAAAGTGRERERELMSPQRLAIGTAAPAQAACAVWLTQDAAMQRNTSLI